MPLIGIPSFIKPAGPSAVQCTHYFVSVRPTDRLQPTLPSGAPDTAASAEPCELPCTTTLSKPTPSVCNPACSMLSKKLGPHLWHATLLHQQLLQTVHHACSILDVVCCILSLGLAFN